LGPSSGDPQPWKWKWDCRLKDEHRSRKIEFTGNCLSPKTHHECSQRDALATLTCAHRRACPERPSGFRLRGFSAYHFRGVAGCRVAALVAGVAQSNQQPWPRRMLVPEGSKDCHHERVSQHIPSPIGASTALLFPTQSSTSHEICSECMPSPFSHDQGRRGRRDPPRPRVGSSIGGQRVTKLAAHRSNRLGLGRK
jgi:hypothetical protein